MLHALRQICRNQVPTVIVHPPFVDVTAFFIFPSFYYLKKIVSEWLYATFWGRKERIFMHNIIALWTYPRTVSTAFERVMIERRDLEVFHEPFSYLFYVEEQKGTCIPEQMDEQHPRTYPEIRDMILSTAQEKPVFIKDMSLYCLDYLLDDIDFLASIENTFLIRNPAKTIPSYYALNPNVQQEEIGCQQVLDHFVKADEIMDKTPVVIDADDFQARPEETVAAYCDALGVPHVQEAMEWESGSRNEWAIWEKWHQECAESTGIQSKKQTYKVTVENNETLAKYYEFHRPAYEELYEYRILPDKSN